MRPEEFGPFLTEQRKRKGLTQTDLAERIHVSTAAVSKWERGKCLPELGKLEDIAQVLEISVLEVMQCSIFEEPVAPEPIKETYVQTVDLSKRQYRKSIVRWTVVILAVAALVMGYHYFPLHRVAKVWYPSYFETGEISQLAYIGTKEDRQIAEEVLKVAELAFSDLKTPREEKAEKYGLLSRYAVDAERGAAGESHSLELWSAHFDSSSGTMWVYYYKEAYDENGDLLCGSWDIPSLWYLEKNKTGEWVVTGIKERP